MLNSEEYLIKLFGVSADALGVKFTNTTASKLQVYAQTNKPPFLALLGMGENPVRSVENNLINFSVTCVFIMDASPDPKEEDVQKIQSRAGDYIKRFLRLCNRNKQTFITDTNLSQLFRDGSYSGIGKGFTFTATLPDRTDYCQDQCNESTVNLDCDV